MRPIASTSVASMQNIAAPESARLPRWVKCQSLATPSSAEYWHIGDTTMRFFSVRPRRLIGENRALMRGVPEMEGGSWRECSERWRRLPAARPTWRPAGDALRCGFDHKRATQSRTVVPATANPQTCPAAACPGGSCHLAKSRRRPRPKTGSYCRRRPASSSCRAHRACRQARCRRRRTRGTR